LANRTPNSLNTTNKADALRLAWGRGLMPPPRISVPAWSDKFRRHSQHEGGGRWKTAKMEVARGPMLSATEPGVRIITAMTATQILKSSLLLSVFGYFAHLDPCPMMLVQPKDEAAAAFSKERITPMISATPVLRKLVGTRKTRASDETIGFKSFPGGFLAIVGAGSPTNLASRPVRVICYDEIDKYEATKEGDPIALGEERQAKFETNSLSLRVCSPSVEDESRIAASYAKSDQRRASVACPCCGHRQFLDFFTHVQWDKTLNERGETVEHRTETARIYCEDCGVGWSEGERLRALETIRWHQTRPFTCCDRPFSPLDDYARAVTRRKSDPDAPDPVTAVWEWWESDLHAVYRAKCPCCGGWPVPNGHAGFQASKLYSGWGKDKPSAIAKKWIDAQGDDEALQTFWNTQLALPYRPRIGRDIKPSHLMERREVWAGDVPDGVVVVTIGVDVQGDRIELEIVGWGRREESWSLAYLVLEGDTAQQPVWDHLDEVLQRPLFRADGRPFVAAAVCIDSGDGNRTQEVYAFCKARRLRKVWAIKGASESGGQRQPVWPTSKPTRRSSNAYKPVIIGTNAAKDTISARLQIEAPGPGYMHFPVERDEAYFAQLTGERLVPKQKGGRKYRVWTPKRGVAHEALDCRVYAYAGLWGLVMQHRLDLDKEAVKVGAARETRVIRADTPEAQRIASQKQAAALVPAEPARAPEPKKPPPARKVGRSQWLQSRGR